MRSPKAKLGRAPWAIVAGVVLLLGAGVFYAYQRRNSVSVPSPSSTPINKVEVQVSPEPASTPLASGRSLEESKAQTELRPSETRKKESVTRNRTTTTRKEPLIVDEVHMPEIEVPAVRTEDFPNTGRPGTHPPLTPRQLGRNGRDVQITLEDGTVLRTRPDGTRVIITPNGTRRVIPPRMRPQRRRF